MKCAALLLIKRFSLSKQTRPPLGIIIDNMCADTNKDMLASFVKTHTKECALMKDCAASGYSLYMDGKLMKFDKTSNTLVEKFLKQPKSSLKVVVKAKKAGNELRLQEISNQ